MPLKGWTARRKLEPAILGTGMGIEESRLVPRGIKPGEHLVAVW